MKKLVLYLSCPTYAVARALDVHLGQRGFNAGVQSSYPDVWYVIVTSSPDSVNIGSNPFDELQQAYSDAAAFLLTEIIPNE